MFSIKIISWLPIACIVLMSGMADTQNDLQLMLVQLVMRHGERAPIFPYPNDPNPMSAWPAENGRLTLRGKRQQYELGKLLHKMYSDFITTSPYEVYARSADSDRCITSAQSNLATFFRPNEKWKFVEDFDWQPIPIQVVPDKYDKVLSTTNDCPIAMENKMNITMIQDERIRKQHPEMFDYLTHHSGTKIDMILTALGLFDTMGIEKDYNLTVPDWINPYWDVLDNLATSFYSWGWNSDILRRLRGGPLLEDMINNMRKKINGSIPDLKVIMYSAHDINIVVFLESLKFHIMKQIPFATTALLELYGQPSGPNLVRLLYLNTTSDDKFHQTPHVLQLEGCSEYCPLEHLVEMSQPFLPDDWEKECGLKKEDRSKEC